MNTKLLRQKILDLAIRGKLTEQKKSDGTTKDLLVSIAASSACHSERSAKGAKSKNLANKEIIPLDKSEAPFEIPENWEWVRLGDVCFFFNGFAFDSKEFKDEGTPIIRISNIADRKIDLSKCVFSSELLSESFIVSNGDLLIAMSGATTGKMGVYDKDDKAYLNQRIGNIKIKDDSILFSGYRNYYLYSQSENILTQAYGGAQPNISSKAICEMLIPLPPLAEQQRIVTAIENAFAEITEIENNQELLKKHIKQGRQKILDLAIRGKLTQQLKTDGTTKDLLKQIQDERTGEALQTRDASTCHCEAQKRRGNLKQSKSAFSKEIIPLDKTTAPFEIPENWEWVRLGDVCTFFNGYAFDSKEFKDEGFPIIRISNIADSKIDLSKCVFSSELLPESFVVSKGDLLIAMSGATTGKMGVYDNDYKAYLNQRVGNIKIKDDNILFSGYRNYYLSSQTENILAQAYGGAQPNISSKAICEMPIPLPPLAEQQRIVATIEQAFAEFDAMEVGLM